jgi:UDP-3-O-[3-hydroxymyristoyl] N-acetylglucosamine deacetylase
MQQTLKNELKISGIGLHSGCVSNLIISPAEENKGIVFWRTDLNCKIPALYTNVVDTRNCTCLGKDGQIVSTIEHVMATLYAFGIDNADIGIDNPEVPILDGSAKVICDFLKDAEIVEQSEKRKVLRVKKELKFADDKGNFVSLKPAEKFKVGFEIDFPSKIVGHQKFSEIISKELFVEEIAQARTFCEKYQVDYLRSVGLIKGGSLENAVVLDGETILNEGGFRLSDECVKHKAYDYPR